MDIKACEQKIGVNFVDKTLLEQAFTHRSYLNENRDIKRPHNERLEFLGDAVLELIVTDFLYRNYPDKNEGDLTSYRSAVVNAQVLAGVSQDLGFNDFLLLSKGESKDTGRARNYILANTYESVLGAIYLDQGYAVAKEFVTKNLFGILKDVVEKGLWVDAKSRLQEVVQGKLSITPVYRTVKEDGPDHDKKFTVAVFVNDKKLAEGTGQSKQEAEQSAAQTALKEDNLNQQ